MSFSIHFSKEVVGIFFLNILKCLHLFSLNVVMTSLTFQYHICLVCQRHSSENYIKLFLWINVIYNVNLFLLSHLSKHNKNT